MEAEIKIEPSGRHGIIATGSYLFDAAKRLGIQIDDECGRQGVCDSCAVKIIKGGELLSAVTKAETEHLSAERRKKGERLSCQAKIEKNGEIVVMVTEKKQAGKAEKEDKTAGFHKEFEEMPLEKKIATLVEMEIKTLGETFSFVLNSPFKIGEKIMNVMAEFGMDLEKKAKEAKRPGEHKDSANGKKTAAAPKSKTAAKKTTAKRKPAGAKQPPAAK